METNIFISPRGEEVTCLLNLLCYLVKLLLCLCASNSMFAVVPFPNENTVGTRSALGFCIPWFFRLITIFSLK